MKFYLISDNVDTLMGMHLAGIDGVVVHEEQEVQQALLSAMNREDVEVIKELLKEAVALMKIYISAMLAKRKKAQAKLIRENEETL